jgi:hypothetical protein
MAQDSLRQWKSSKIRKLKKALVSPAFSGPYQCHGSVAYDFAQLPLSVAIARAKPDPMSENDTTYPLGDKASVLFSGGTDSTLAAYEIATRVRHTTLLTLDPGFIFFIENSKRHADMLIEKLGADRVTHEIIPIKPFIKNVLLGDKKGDWAKYRFNLTALTCLGCRMSMHAAALCYNLEHEIPVIVDGSIEKQSTIPEQLESFIRLNRRRLWGKYGIRHYSPIYQIENSDQRLDQLGLSIRPELKKQFILFDSQPTCPIGVPADVYARLFYGDLAGPARQVDAYEYSQDRYPLIYKIVESRFEGRSPDLAELVEAVKQLSSALPDSWEEASRD